MWVNKDTSQRNPSFSGRMLQGSTVQWICRRKRQRTHGKPSPWKWSIVHLCVSLLPPLPSCFYTSGVLHPRSFLSRCSLLLPPPPSSSPHIKEEKHTQTVAVSFRCATNLTERSELELLKSCSPKFPFWFFDYVTLRNCMCKCKNIWEALDLLLVVIFLDKTSISALLVLYQ